MRASHSFRPLHSGRFIQAFSFRPLKGSHSFRRGGHGASFRPLHSGLSRGGEAGQVCSDRGEGRGEVGGLQPGHQVRLVACRTRGVNGRQPQWVHGGTAA
jgi:hypothetical protein